VVAEDRQVLLTLGRVSEEKRFDLAMEAFAALAPRFPDWDLVVLGEGLERDRLEAQREALGLAGRVHLPGRVGNLADWYQRASLYVLSSRFEGFPNTLLEAMAHGLPAVSVDCDTGPRDLIRPGLDGVLVALESGPAALAEVLGELMAEPRRRARMGEAAAEVRERYAMARIAAEWDRVLGLE
jgi:glycosyltransferase involved in cell wall biosynthesis